MVDSFFAALDAWRRRAPEQEAIVDYEVARLRATGEIVPRQRMTVATMWDTTVAAATALRSGGIGPGDIIAIQLPTWAECYIAAIAVHAIGAVPMLISPVYRTRDVDAQIRLSRAVGLIVSARFGTFDYVEMAQQLQAEIPSLRLLVAVGLEARRDRVIAWQDLVAAGAAPERAGDRAEIGSGRLAPAPDAMALLNFSSGTTGEPKGITHSTRSAEASCLGIIERLELDASERFFIPVTLGHAAGYLNGLLMPLLCQATVVFMDLWDPGLSLSVIEKERTTYAPMMPTHLFDLAQHPRFDTADLTSWTKARVSGGPVGREIVASVHSRRPHLRLCPGWGFTECLYLTGSGPRDDVDLRNRTEGLPLSNCRIEVRDPSFNRLLPAGELGEIVVKATSQMLGYFNRAELTRSSFTADGWFKSGDLGSIDQHGVLTVNGRSKDLIIRGGENVPAVEIEHLLLRHAKVRTAVVVGLPDARLGERVCAVVVCRSPDEPLEFEEMKTFLVDCKLTRQFIPEKLVVLDSLPMTISDKIKKREVRDQVLNLLKHQNAAPVQN